MGRADRDVSGSRSLRTTTYEMPCRARVSASPAEGRPAANSRCTESSARIVSGGVSGMESRTPHGLLPRTCSGSSWLLPHTWVANGAPGTTSTRPGCRGVPVLFASSQSAVSCQYCGIASNAPGGVSRPVQASDVAAVRAVSTTMPTATRLSRLRVGERVAPHRPRRAAGKRDAAEQVGQPERQRQAAAAVRACAGCAAGCRPRRGTPGPDARSGNPARRSNRRPAARRRASGS